MKQRTLEVAMAVLVIGSSLTAALAGLGSVTVSTSETSVLSANDRRRWLILQNNSTSDIWVKVDSSTNVLTTNNGIRLAAGASLTITSTGEANPAINAVKAITAAGSGSITYSEGNEF